MMLLGLTLCGLLAQLLPAGDLPSQPGFVKVLVVDPMNVQLPGVEVVARAQFGAKRLSQVVVTNYRGEARIGPLEPGSYEISCKLTGLDADYVAVVRVVERPARVILSMSLALSSGDRIGPGEPAVPRLPMVKTTPSSPEEPR